MPIFATVAAGCEYTDLYRYPFWKEKVNVEWRAETYSSVYDQIELRATVKDTDKPGLTALIIVEDTLVFRSLCC